MRWMIAAAVLVGCSPRTGPANGTPSGSPSTSAASPAASASSAQARPDAGSSAHESLAWIDDDVPGSLAKAKASGKLMFVDAWAPWCHTCLSMKHFVFEDPSLRPLGDSIVFAAVDTDRDKNSAFVDKYAIDVWPTFFVIEPESGAVLGYWPGAASVREMNDFIHEALAAKDARKAAKLDPKSPLALLLKAKEAQASSKYDAAAKLYGDAIDKAPADWNRRSEALVGWVGALYNGGHAEECVSAGMKHTSEVKGAAAPTDYLRGILACAEHLKDAQKQKSVTERVRDGLKKIVEAPDPESTPDDRADTLEALAEVLADLGDKAGAHAAYEKRLGLLEKAAADAPSPSAASTYDYARANTYLQLGRANDAIKMLEEREKQLPDSYEPPGRLAGVLSALKRYPEALSAIDRALKNAYGPRRLRYLETKASIQAALGDYDGQIKTLDEEVTGYEAQAKRQAAKPQRLETAKKRLAEAKRALAAAKTKSRP